VSVAAVVFKLAAASLLEVATDLSFVITEQSTDIVATGEVSRHGVADLPQLVHAMGEGAHAAQGALSGHLPVPAELSLVLEPGCVVLLGLGACFGFFKRLRRSVTVALLITRGCSLLFLFFGRLGGSTFSTRSGWLPTGRLGHWLGHEAPVGARQLAWHDGHGIKRHDGNCIELVSVLHIWIDLHSIAVELSWSLIH